MRSSTRTSLSSSRADDPRLSCNATSQWNLESSLHYASVVTAVRFQMRIKKDSVVIPTASMSECRPPPGASARSVPCEVVRGLGGCGLRPTCVMACTSVLPRLQPSGRSMPGGLVAPSVVYGEPKHGSNWLLRDSLRVVRLVFEIMPPMSDIAARDLVCADA